MLLYSLVSIRKNVFSQDKNIISGVEGYGRLETSDRSMVDLFIMNRNCKLPIHVSSVLDFAVWKGEVFQHSFDHLDIYAFALVCSHQLGDSLLWSFNNSDSSTVATSRVVILTYPY